MPVALLPRRQVEAVRAAPPPTYGTRTTCLIRHTHHLPDTAHAPPAYYRFALGDRIIGINGQPTTGLQQAVDLISAAKGEEYTRANAD